MLAVLGMAIRPRVWLSAGWTCDLAVLVQFQYQQQQQQHLQQGKLQQLQTFWQQQMKGIERVTDFKSHSLPLARIKKIMKSDEDVRVRSRRTLHPFAVVPRARSLALLCVMVNVTLHSCITVSLDGVTGMLCR